MPPAGPVAALRNPFLTVLMAQLNASHFSDMDRPEAQEMTEFRGRSELTAGPIKKFRFIKGILPKLLNRPLDSL
ncbi:hypothetical protein CWB41_02945 [Methylovirgula ligni]|nr:hypothetical protein CWB41_02945 [Methylovirgula ligni]